MFSRGFRDLDAPPSAQAGSQVASGRLTPAARDLDGGKVPIFYQVLNNILLPFLKLRTGHKQQWPLPVAPVGRHRPCFYYGSSRYRLHSALHCCPAHPWTGPVIQCPNKAARVTVRKGSCLRHTPAGLCRVGRPGGAPGTHRARQAVGAQRAFFSGVKENTPTLTRGGV